MISEIQSIWEVICIPKYRWLEPNYLIQAVQAKPWKGTSKYNTGFAQDLCFSEAATSYQARYIKTFRMVLSIYVKHLSHFHDCILLKINQVHTSPFWLKTGAYQILGLQNKLALCRMFKKISKRMSSNQPKCLFQSSLSVMLAIQCTLLILGVIWE